MGNPITSLTLYAPEGKLSGLCAIRGGVFYMYDSNQQVTSYSGATIDADAYVTMVQAMDVLYGTDGINPPFAFGGVSSTEIVTGTVNTTTGETTVIGNSTKFLSQVAVGEQITVNGETHIIETITDDTTLDTTTVWVGTFPTAAYTVTTVALSVPGVRDASGTTLAGVTDMVWFMDRMWYAVGDLIHFSDVGNPLSITEAPIRCRLGAGDKIVKLMPYRDSYLLAWKRDVYGLGSLNAFDVSSNDPTQFTGETVPWFDNQSIISPRCIIQTGVTQSADIVFNSREGLRSLTYTSLDKLTYPSLPITQNIPDLVAEFHGSQMDKAFCILFDDELLLFAPTGSATTPNITLGYSLKIPRENMQQGFVLYDMMPATCACVGSLDGNAPKLFLGTADGNIQEAFAVTGTHTYTEISKRITYDKPDQDKTPMKYILEQDQDATGSVTVSLLMADNTEQILGTQSWIQAGVKFPVTFPCVFPPNGIATDFSDTHFDVSGNSINRSKDFRSKITSTASPSILGFSLQATLEEFRYQGLNEDIAAITPEPLTESELTGANFEG